MCKVQGSIVAGVVLALFAPALTVASAHAAETAPHGAAPRSPFQAPVTTVDPLSSTTEQRHAALWSEAIEAFSVEDYAHASRVFETLYAEFRDLDALFNLAQTYAKQGQCSLAVPRARAHLAEQPGTDRTAEAWQTLETACPELRADWVSPPPAAPIDATIQPTQALNSSSSAQPIWPGSIAPRDTTPGAVAASGATSSGLETSDSGSRGAIRAVDVGGWILVGTGVAAAATSIAFLVAGAQTQDQVNGLGLGTSYTEVERLDARGKKQNVAAVGFAAAAAVTAGVGVFLLWSVPGNATHSEISVGFLPGLASASFRGRF